MINVRIKIYNVIIRCKQMGHFTLFWERVHVYLRGVQRQIYGPLIWNNGQDKLFLDDSRIRNLLTVTTPGSCANQLTGSK